MFRVCFSRFVIRVCVFGCDDSRVEWFFHPCRLNGIVCDSRGWRGCNGQIIWIPAYLLLLFRVNSTFYTIFFLSSVSNLYGGEDTKRISNILNIRQNEQDPYQTVKPTSKWGNVRRCVCSFYFLYSMRFRPRILLLLLFFFFVYWIDQLQI